MIEFLTPLGWLVAAAALVPIGAACGIWDGRRDHVFLFTLHLDRLPDLQLDNREIIAARLVSPDSSASGSRPGGWGSGPVGEPGSAPGGDTSRCPRRYAALPG